jgi:acyl carrier protein
VKVRGYRIELGEIEAVLARHDAVQACAVVVSERSAADARLVACVVLRPGRATTVTDLRRSLAEKLPAYMIPSAMVMVDELPLTPNGKVDRRALERLGGTGAVPSGYEPPRTAHEQAIAELWRDVLGVERVGIFDNFFELGGHSLLATQVISRILTTLGVEVPLRTIFEAPTVAALATRVASAQVSEPSIQAPDLVPVAREAYRATSDHRRQQ